MLFEVWWFFFTIFVVLSFNFFIFILLYFDNLLVLSEDDILFECFSHFCNLIIWIFVDFVEMNSAQVTAFQLGICVKNSKSCVLQKCIVNSFPRIRNISVRDKPLFGLKSLKPLRAGGKGMSGNSDEVGYFFLIIILFLIVILMYLNCLILFGF